MSHKSILTQMPLLVLLIMPSSVLAASRFNVPPAEILIAEADQTINEDQAAAIAEKQSGGKVISSETDTSNGQIIYLIKILKGDGLITIVKVDAASGKVL